MVQMKISWRPLASGAVALENIRRYLRVPHNTGVVIQIRFPSFFVVSTPNQVLVKQVSDLTSNSHPGGTNMHVGFGIVLPSGSLVC